MSSVYIVETVDRHEVVREATAAGWNTARRFMELKEYFRGDALESYKKLVADNYPNPADKKNAIYEELVRLISTDLRDYPNHGNMICQYMMNKIKYMTYHRLARHRYKPTDALCRLRQLRTLGGRLKNSMPGGNRYNSFWV